MDEAERTAPKSARNIKENVEYHSLINALDNFIRDIQNDIQKIEQDNGVAFNTRGSED
jgi:hypothetical protein